MSPADSPTGIWLWPAREESGWPRVAGGDDISPPNTSAAAAGAPAGDPPPDDSSKIIDIGGRRHAGD